jgi:ATP-dependent Clp protease ATP-binding subunit ClpB
MLEKQGISLQMSEPAKDLLASLGYDPQFGARPMKRVLQKKVINELSKLVLSGAYGPGDTVFVDAEAEALTFTRQAYDTSLTAEEVEAE